MAFPSPLPESWQPVAADRAAGLLRELRLEVVEGHLLYQCAVRAVAACNSCDDALFQHLAAPERYTVVHLTYRGGPEINAQHPTVEFDGSWAAFVAEQRRVDDYLAGPN